MKQLPSTLNNLTINLSNNYLAGNVNNLKRITESIKFLSNNNLKILTLDLCFNSLNYNDIQNLEDELYEVQPKLQKLDLIYQD